MNNKGLVMHARFFSIILPFLVFLIPARVAGKSEASPQADTLERLQQVCAADEYAFTPEVRRAFLARARQQALASLKTKGQSLPQEFLAWVDADLEIASGVYAAHPAPEDVLLWLYSLRLDLGEARFEKYRHLALAAALVSTKEGMEPDLTPRKPLNLVIPGDPRQPVDTRTPERELDVNDHIVNFLNEHTIEDEVPVGKIEPPELKYDERGIAIPAPKESGKKRPATEKQVRTLYAADVFARKDLQDQFNRYMKSKGQDIVIDCGDRVLHWNSKEAVHGEQRKNVEAAYRLFRTAYEAKGLLPAERDPFASPAERCAYLIRNHEYQFPPELQEQRNWPRFPLTAPWPLLTMLAADRQPLREREERWIAYRDRGEFHQYGEYIGAIAQQFSMQSARRLKPYGFSYATIQMMLKDGGVCGTMGSIAARGGNALGIPSCQATQPGHCAFVSFHFDPETRTYQCKGGQYATGGDERTGPFTPWPFDSRFRRINRKSGHEVEFHNRQPMVYHQSLAWGVNHGLQSYLDATIAHAVFRLLPEELGQDEGMKLLESGLARNPYQFLLVDAALDTAATPREQLRFWKQFQAALTSAVDRPGCPGSGLYPATVKNKMLARIAKMPVPKDLATAREILTWLEQEEGAPQKTLDAYRQALQES